MIMHATENESLSPLKKQQTYPTQSKIDYSYLETSKNNNNSEYFLLKSPNNVEEQQSLETDQDKQEKQNKIHQSDSSYNNFAKNGYPTCIPHDFQGTANPQFKVGQEGCEINKQTLAELTPEEKIEELNKQNEKIQFDNNNILQSNNKIQKEMADSLLEQKYSITEVIEMQKEIAKLKPSNEVDCYYLSAEEARRYFELKAKLKAAENNTWIEYKEFEKISLQRNIAIGLFIFAFLVIIFLLWNKHSSKKKNNELS